MSGCHCPVNGGPMATAVTWCFKIAYVISFQEGGMLRYKVAFCNFMKCIEILSEIRYDHMNWLSVSCLTQWHGNQFSNWWWARGDWPIGLMDE